MPTELLDHPSEDYRRTPDLFAFEEAPIAEKIEATPMNNETDIALRLGRTSAEGYLSYDELMKRKSEMAKDPEKVPSVTAKEIIDQISHNILVMRSQAMETGILKSRDSYNK